MQPGQIYDLHYEQLVEDPVRELRKAYEHLKLNDFDSVTPKLEAFAGRKREYRTNRYQLSPNSEQKILQNWGDFATRYGYTTQDR